MKSRREIEQAVSMLMSNHGVQSPPVPVKDIAEAEGLVVVEAPFQSDVSGALVQSNGRAAIAVNGDQHPNRVRFTIAHELAHYVLAHKGEKDHIDWTFTVLRRDGKSSEATDEDEMEANFFAASLLMPRGFVRNDVATLARFDGEAALNSEDVKTLARRYGVSEIAMNYRLINLGLMDPVG
jgi:Zn-dependent peptidase ImmA (M78 family)